MPNVSLYWGAAPIGEHLELASLYIICNHNACFSDVANISDTMQLCRCPLFNDQSYSRGIVLSRSHFF